MKNLIITFFILLPILSFSQATEIYGSAYGSTPDSSRLVITKEDVPYGNLLDLQETTYIRPYSTGGFRAYRVDTAQYVGAPLVSLGTKLFIGNEGWFVDASASYTSYSIGSNNRNRFIHYRGGFGLTNESSAFFGIYAGYMQNIDKENKQSSATLDMQASFHINFSEKLAAILSGHVGTSINKLKNSSNLTSNFYLGGQIGVAYKFNLKRKL